MTTTTPSTALATVQPTFTVPERLTLAGFLTGYRRLTPTPTRSISPVHHLVPGRSSRLFAVRRPTSRASPGPGSPGPGPRHGRRPLSTIAGYPDTRSRKNSSPAHRPPMSAVRGWTTSPCRRLRPQQARCPAGRRRARDCRRACPDFPAGPERAAGLGGNLRGHRAPGPGARAQDADHYPQGRQDRHRPAGTAHGPGDRPGHRRAHRRAGVPGRGRAAAGPARRRADRPQDGPPGRDRQGRHAPHASARVHHRRPGRRGAAAGCTRRRLACRPADHDAV